MCMKIIMLFCLRNRDVHAYIPHIGKNYKDINVATALIFVVFCSFKMFYTFSRIFQFRHILYYQYLSIWTKRCVVIHIVFKLCAQILFVCGFTSYSRTFHSYVDVTITDKGLRPMAIEQWGFFNISQSGGRRARCSA